MGVLGMKKISFLNKIISLLVLDSFIFVSCDMNVVYSDNKDVSYSDE